MKEPPWWLPGDEGLSWSLEHGLPEDQGDTVPDSSSPACFPPRAPE